MELAERRFWTVTVTLVCHSLSSRRRPPSNISRDGSHWKRQPRQPASWRASPHTAVPETLKHTQIHRARGQSREDARHSERNTEERVRAQTLEVMTVTFLWLIVTRRTRYVLGDSLANNTGCNPRYAPPARNHNSVEYFTQFNREG